MRHASANVRLPDRIKYWRDMQRLTQAALAHSIDVAVRTVLLWENGGVETINSRNLRALSDALGVPVVDLYSPGLAPSLEPEPDVADVAPTLARHRQEMTAIEPLLRFQNDPGQWRRGGRYLAISHGQEDTLWSHPALAADHEAFVLDYCRRTRRERRGIFLIDPNMLHDIRKLRQFGVALLRHQLLKLAFKVFPSLALPPAALPAASDRCMTLLGDHVAYFPVGHDPAKPYPFIDLRTHDGDVLSASEQLFDKLWFDRTWVFDDSRLTRLRTVLTPEHEQLAELQAEYVRIAAKKRGAVAE